LLINELILRCNKSVAEMNSNMHKHYAEVYASKQAPTDSADIEINRG
jgi:hypothetical protein